MLLRFKWSWGKVTGVYSPVVLMCHSDTHKRSYVKCRRQAVNVRGCTKDEVSSSGQNTLIGIMFGVL